MPELAGEGLVFHAVIPLSLSPLILCSLCPFPSTAVAFPLSSQCSTAAALGCVFTPDQRGGWPGIQSAMQRDCVHPSVKSPPVADNQGACDLNWAMLKPLDQVLKQWYSLKLSQIITNPTRYDPHQSGVFCNDLSDHCFTACVRNGCSIKRHKFWKMVKDLENKPSSSQLPMSLNVDDVVVTDKECMAELFNHHFINHASLPVQHFLISQPF
ncbi:unnamed protein product [Coregonus sp. 'balchen']|nr:unnamed protein product [Coregonus sp. 'balchen']